MRGALCRSVWEYIGTASVADSPLLSIDLLTEAVAALLDEAVGLESAVERQGCIRLAACVFSHALDYIDFMGDVVESVQLALSSDPGVEDLDRGLNGIATYLRAKGV